METPNNHDGLEIFYKFSGWIFGVLVGLVGLMGRILTEGKKLPTYKIAGIALVSVFIGYQTFNLCDYLGWDNAHKILVPVTTMYGQYISYYISQNYSRILTGLFDIFLNRNKKN